MTIKLYLLSSKGAAKANEVLILGKKLNAKEALQYGFVNDIFQDNELLTKVMQVAQQIAESPIESLLASKRVSKQRTK